MKKKTVLAISIGWIGSINLVVAYVLLTLEMLDAHGFVFNSMQLFGGACLAYRVWVDRNWSNLALEAFFVSVAVYAIIKSFL